MRPLTISGARVAGGSPRPIRIRRTLEPAPSATSEAIVGQCGRGDLMTVFDDENGGRRCALEQSPSASEGRESVRTNPRVDTAPRARESARGQIACDAGGFPEPGGPPTQRIGLAHDSSMAVNRRGRGSMRSGLGGMSSVTGRQKLDMGNSFRRSRKSGFPMPLWIILDRESIAHDGSEWGLWRGSPDPSRGRRVVLNWRAGGDSNGGGAGGFRCGISICFHPKSRASIDQAPGPSKASATPTVPSNSACRASVAWAKP